MALSIQLRSRIGFATILLTSTLLRTGSSQDLSENDSKVLSTTELVGRTRDDVIVTPVNQLLTPFGKQVELAGMRPQALALSPDKKLIAVSGKTAELVILSPATGEVLQRVAFPADAQLTPPEVTSPNILQPDRKGLVSFTGLIFSPDGKQIFLSNVQGSIKVFRVDAAGSVTPSHSIPLPPAKAPRRLPEIPSGLAISEDGSRLFVCGNLSNRLIEIDTKEHHVLRTFDVGMVPYDVVLVADKAVVSNWAGRRPEEKDLTGPGGKGTLIRVDPIRHIASEGSVTFIDLKDGTTKEIVTGLHASALAVSPDKKFVVCTNAASDTLSILDVATQQIKETVWAKRKPSDLVGATPNALQFDRDGKRLYVCNGTQNAVGVFDWDPEDKGETKMIGMIPVGWFPGAIFFDSSRNRIGVANIKGLPITPKKKDGTVGFNSHHYHGSVSLIDLPDGKTLDSLSERVAKNLRAGSIAATAMPARKEVAPKAIPERIGEPSLIKHVVYIIKENRTYDQVFGKVAAGNGNADLCIFGEEVTPNQHRMVRDFVLLDNAYCSGILSADGHQWSTTAFGTDYIEKSFAGFPRSYPDGMGEDEVDALAYSPAGFIWDNAILHKKSIRNYGEFMIPKVRWRDPAKKGKPNYMACYRTWKGESNEVIFESAPGVPSIAPFSPTAYVGWEMAVPDQVRADFIIKELAEFEAKKEFPNLTIICLPNDHTSGTSVGSPTPGSCMADNDLAFGRIVEALSHSSFWPNMAIFATEDDPQAGWDHVSGYRTTMYCVSPYAKRGVTISTQYNTTSLIRTIEQILGMPPMNQFDASATPMWDCFVDVPNSKPFEKLANTIPLDQMNPDPKAILDPLLKKNALVSATLNFEEIDKAPEDVLNRILWHAMKGSQKAYPEWAISNEEEESEEAEEKETSTNSISRE